MTEKQARALTAMLATLYDVPAWEPERLKVFASQLLDLPYEAAAAAVTHWMRTSDKRPCIADIRGACRQQLEEAGTIPTDPDVDQAWGIVMETIRRVGRYRPFPDTYPRIKAAVDRMGWEDLCNAENVEVVRAQFERFYRAELTREHDARHAAPALQRPNDQARLAGTERKQVSGGKVLALPSRAAAVNEVRKIYEVLATKVYLDVPQVSTNQAKEMPQLREPTDVERCTADSRKAQLREQARKLAS